MHTLNRHPKIQAEQFADYIRQEFLPDVGKYFRAENTDTVCNLVATYIIYLKNSHLQQNAGWVLKRVDHLLIDDENRWKNMVEFNGQLSIYLSENSDKFGFDYSALSGEVKSFYYSASEEMAR